MMKIKLLLLVLASLLWHITPAYAEVADKNKPIELEADRIMIDDLKKVHTLEGNVKLIKGTILIRTEKLVVTQDAAGFQTVVATGGADGLARFRQKREGKNEYIEGEAERIEYRDKAEKAEFFIRAKVKSGQDEVSGQYISYDARTESYSVNGKGKGTLPDGRVKAVIQPRTN